MTDWERMSENITHAMQALDEAHQASQVLRREVNPDNYAAFKAQMNALCERLRRMNEMLEHEKEFTHDEIVDLLSLIFSGEKAAYRHTQR